jgi:glycosyltransferase involved in cell wall biosynthesis
VIPLRRLAPALRRLRAERTEHIHVHFAAEAALSALRACRLTGIPFSVTAHAYELFQLPANLSAKLGEAAFVTVPCAYNARELERAGLAGEHVHVRMLGTDTRVIARVAPPPQDGLTLAVGRLIEKKGFHVLIEAAARRDLGRVAIVGEGPWRGRLEALIAEHGLQERVTLPGAAAPADIRGWMERASVLAVPSVTTADGDQDALPVVLWEALAMELPVVGTAVAGIPEVARPPWGSVVAPGDAGALADAIAARRTAPYDERVSAGRAGREWLEANHTQARAVDRLIELIAASGPR